jgi:uncharacterized membrane protein (Fun14 family)
LTPPDNEAVNGYYTPNPLQRCMDLPSLLAENIVQGFLIGLVVGLVVRVASKGIRNLLILQFVLLKFLESRNLLIIDWHRLTNGLIGQKELVIDQAQDLIDTVVEMGIFGAALAGGFLLAQRIGK